MLCARGAPVVVGGGLRGGVVHGGRGLGRGCRPIGGAGLSCFGLRDGAAKAKAAAAERGELTFTLFAK